MQQVPKRRGGTELLSFDPVEQVVASDQSKTNCGNYPSRQVDQRRECNHRRTNREDHLNDKVTGLSAFTASLPCSCASAAPTKPRIRPIMDCAAKMTGRTHHSGCR